VSDSSNKSLHLHTMVSSFHPLYSICTIMLRSSCTQFRLCLADVYTFMPLFPCMYTYSCIPYHWNDTSGIGMLTVLVIHTGILLAVPISADHPFYASDTQGSLRRESLIPFCLLTCRSEAHPLCLMCVNKHPLYNQLILYHRYRMRS
jgi:prepilin signal peptidase PulO-like enzyme (type II secretory pathway)